MVGFREGLLCGTIGVVVLLGAPAYAHSNSLTIQATLTVLPSCSILPAARGVRASCSPGVSPTITLSRAPGDASEIPLRAMTTRGLDGRDITTLPPNVVHTWERRSDGRLLMTLYF